MSWGPKQSVVRVLGPEGTTSGTGTAGSGFVVRGGAAPLIATCAHVIRSKAAAGPGDRVRVMLQDGSTADAVVDPKSWREPHAEDIAFLRREHPLPGTCPPLELARLQDYRRVHRTWGYPLPKVETGHGGQVTELAPSMDAGFPALSARSAQVSYGFSGAPVWDDEGGRGDRDGYEHRAAGGRAGRPSPDRVLRPSRPAPLGRAAPSCSRPGTTPTAAWRSSRRSTLPCTSAASGRSGTCCGASRNNISSRWSAYRAAASPRSRARACGAASTKRPCSASPTSPAFAFA